MTAPYEVLSREAGQPTVVLDLEARTADGRGLYYHALKTMLDLWEVPREADGGEPRPEGPSSRWRMLNIGRLLTGPALKQDARQLVGETIRWLLDELGPPEEDDWLDHDQLKWVGRSYAHLRVAMREAGPEEVLGLTRVEYLEALEPLRVRAEARPRSYWAQVYQELAGVTA